MSEMTKIDTGIKLEVDKFDPGEFFGVMIEVLGLVILVVALRDPASLLQLYVASGRMFYIVQRPLAGHAQQAFTLVRTFLPF